MDVKKIFGNNLQLYRKKQGFSQEKLAEVLDISTKHLSDLETGKSFVSAELLENISQVLHISPSALFFSPYETSIDESDWSKIEGIILQETQKMIVSTKLKISEIRNG
ncbi:MAG: helix-turn-helix transcriptional regulator [Treponema sp.]|nr:helix-turn-helix transcriptional regulator [Treponema sp.]